MEIAEKEYFDLIEYLQDELQMIINKNKIELKELGLFNKVNNYVREELISIEYEHTEENNTRLEDVLEFLSNTQKVILEQIDIDLYLDQYELEEDEEEIELLY